MDEHAWNREAVGYHPSASPTGSLLTTHTLLPPQVEDDTPTEVVEMDELYTFVGKKREKAYVVMALSRETS